MKTIVLAQQKGGVGKSCTAIHLACCAAADGSNVALIDMDAGQGTVRKWGERRQEAWPTVISVDRPMQLEDVMIDLRAKRFDWAIIDLPGKNAPGIGMGLKEADIVLIPARPLDIDIEAAVDTVVAVSRMKKLYAFLMTIAPSSPFSTRAQQVTEVLREGGHRVSDVVIIQRLAVADAVALGQTVMETGADSRAADEFTALFAWIKENTKRTRNEHSKAATRHRHS